MISKKTHPWEQGQGSQGGAGAVHTYAGRHSTQVQAQLRVQVQGSQVLVDVVHTYGD